jgi:predicted nucleotidyltransferase
MPHAMILRGAPRVSLDVLTQQIRTYLAGTQVERAVVFGSFARGEADVASDLDLVLIESTSRPFVDRGRAHLPLFRLGIGVDLLVYTPPEYARLAQECNPLIERIEREGVLVYTQSAG